MTGVFAVTTHGAAVVKTDDWPRYAATHRVVFATQSGPMTLVDGQVNGKFAATRANRKLRNGVCVGPDGRVRFTLTLKPATFREFAVHQRALGCTQGLFFDCVISGAYAVGTALPAGRPPFGPLVGVVRSN